MNPQHCDRFHLTGFSSSINGNKDGGDAKAKLVTSSRTSSTRNVNHQHHNNAMVDKQQPGSKRQKTLHVEYQRTMFSKSLQKQQITSKRSQKLGDRITALQQLVSPYGKTDTSSVLYEATVCIKQLHEQIKVLTSPYFQIKSLACLQDDKEKKEEDLVSRGLCLVPFSAIINPDRNSQKTIHRFT